MLFGMCLLTDTPALDTSNVFPPSAENFSFSAYVSTTFTTLSFGPSFTVASSLAAAASAVAFCAPPWVARALARFSCRLFCAGPFWAPHAFCFWVSYPGPPCPMRTEKVAHAFPARVFRTKFASFPAYFNLLHLPMKSSNIFRLVY